jgi:hypothetical protein
VEEGHDMISHSASLSRDLLSTSISCPAHMNTTLHLTGQIGLAAKHLLESDAIFIPFFHTQLPYWNWRSFDSSVK